MNFLKEDIERISEFLGIDAENYENSYSWKISNPSHSNQIFLTISNLYNNFEYIGNIINVQTPQGFFELHNTDNYLIFPPDEVFFISENQNKLSCLIIGKNSTCSLFSNIDINIFNQDIADLPQSILLAAMQLSIIRNIQ